MRSGTQRATQRTWRCHEKIQVMTKGSAGYCVSTCMGRGQPQMDGTGNIPNSWCPLVS